MRTPAARRGRRIAAVVVSAIVHVLVLTALALHAPTLFIPSEPRGPPEPIIPVLLMPRLPPPLPAAGAQPGPIRLHRRQLRFTPRELPVPPLPVPERLTTPAPATPVPFRPAPLPEGPREQVQATLRRSPIGCANPVAAGLTRDEREACEEQLAKGVRDAPYMPAGAGLPADKRNALDRAATTKEANRRYIEGKATPGLSDRLGDSGQPSKVRGLPY